MKQLLIIAILIATLSACLGVESELEVPPGGADAPAGGNQAQEMPSSDDGASVGLANPASENCTEQGGSVTIESHPDGGQYGVCLFEDNRQCEEWALMRGDCPVGGVEITGYLTDAARYCAITGGEYVAAPGSSPDDELGTCTLPSGEVCDSEAYYAGKCGALDASANDQG